MDEKEEENLMTFSDGIKSVSGEKIAIFYRDTKKNIYKLISFCSNDERKKLLDFLNSRKGFSIDGIKTSQEVYGITQDIEDLEENWTVVNAGSNYQDLMKLISNAQKEKKQLQEITKKDVPEDFKSDLKEIINSLVMLKNKVESRHLVGRPKKEDSFNYKKVSKFHIQLKTLHRKLLKSLNELG